jgi:hypothetical protein
MEATQKRPNVEESTSDNAEGRPNTRGAPSRPRTPEPSDAPKSGMEPKGNNPPLAPEAGAVNSGSDPDRMGGGSKKEIQPPYGSSPPNREGGKDEGRAIPQNKPERNPGGTSSGQPRNQEAGWSNDRPDEAGNVPSKEKERKGTDIRGDHRSAPGDEPNSY